MKRLTKKEIEEIRKNPEKVDWDYISNFQKLSESFIREFKDKVDWYYISGCQKLSKNFIREFKDKLDWDYISISQKLSESFIREFKDKVDWYYISKYQKLSESFIREFKDKVDWYYISKYQKLSESFIRKFKDKVDWYYISKYQKLSESFIRKFKDKVNWSDISNFQKLSESFIREFKLKIDKDNWLYKSTKFKEDKIRKSNKYKCFKNYFIAYKNIRLDRYSHFNFQYRYMKNKTYETQADYTNEENSFGFSGWTKEQAKEYNEDGKVVRVKVYYKDVARLVWNENKIRASKITILD